MSDIDLVRSLYGDIEPDTDGNYLFDDFSIEGFLKLADNNPYRAAASACRALAVSEAYLLKVVRTDDMQVNGAVVAAELRLLAESLEEQADQFDDGQFEVVDFSTGSSRIPEASTNPWGVL